MTNLPASSLQNLGETELVSSQLISESLVHLGAELVEESHCDTSPLDHNIITRIEHGCDFVGLCGCSHAVLVIVCESPIHVWLLERQDAHVNEEAAVSVFGQACQQLLSCKVNLHDGLHRLHQRVCEPLGQLVEWEDALPRRDGIGLACGVGERRKRRAAGRLGWLGHGAAWPGVAERDSVDGGPRWGPNRCQTVHEDVPQDGKWHDHNA